MAASALRQAPLPDGNHSDPLLGKTMVDLPQLLATDNILDVNALAPERILRPLAAYRYLLSLVSKIVVDKSRR